MSALFDLPKPRRFHYTPRFYDPEKERWEALKQKYAEQHRDAPSESDGSADDDNGDLQYFERRVRELDREERQHNAKLGWRDMFRKREMPQFHYTPRFGDSTTANGDASEPVAAPAAPKRQIKIRRRFDIEDDNYLKPVSGTRIILYCALVCLLLYWIFF